MASFIMSQVSSAIGILTSSSVDKNRVLKVIRTLKQSDGTGDITSVYKLLKKELLDVYRHLEQNSDETGLQCLAHYFYLYEGGKAVTKYIRVLQRVLHEATPTSSRQVEQNVTETLTLVLAVVCRLSLWCTELNLYQQVIESGLLDTLLTEVKWIVVRNDTREKSLVLLLNILHLLYNTAKIPWTKAIIKNRTLPVLLRLHSSDVIRWRVESIHVCANIRFLNSVIAGCLLVPQTGKDVIADKSLTGPGKGPEMTRELVDLVFDCWRVVGERPVANQQKSHRMSLSVCGHSSPEEELLRVSAEVLTQIPDFLQWLAQKDFVPLLTSDILERGSLSEKDRCLRFLLSLVGWESLCFVLTLPRLSRLLLTLVTSSDGCLAELAGALRAKLINTVVENIDLNTLETHRAHLPFSDRDCHVCDVLESLSNLIRQLASRGCDDLIDFMFSELPRDMKRMLLNIPKNGETTLLVAMRKDHKKTLWLLLSDFGADVTQQVLYTHFPSLIQQYVPLLWWAAAEEKVDVMAALLAHGAQVNCTASSGSTPLFAACARQRSIAMRYLLQHGADPNQTDSGGVTCLMKAVVSPFLCDMLLESGAKVDAQDDNGRTALHVAITKRSQSVAKQLVECGADLLGLRDRAGSNALQEACRMRCTELVDYIMEEHSSRVPVEEAVQAYSLLTAYLLSGEQDFTKARHYWNMASRLRNAHGIRQTYTERDEAFPSMRHVCHMSDLAILNTRLIPPPEFALFLKESILGSGHMQTLVSVFSRGLFLLQTGMVDQCLAYWTYVLLRKHQQHTLQAVGYHLQPFECIGCMASIVDVIFDACHGLLKRGTIGHVTFQQVLCVLRAAAEDGVVVADCARIRPLNKSTEESVFKYLMGVIKLVKCGLRLQEEEAELEALTGCVRRLVALNITAPSGQGVLHLATAHSNSGGNAPSICDEAVVTLFLACGSEVNDMDVDNNSALHNCVTSWLVARAGDVSGSVTNARQVAAVLLEYGAHVDALNREGMRCSEVLGQMDIGYQPVKHVGLGCLAARTLKKHRLQHQGLLPKTLCAFIDLH